MLTVGLKYLNILLFIGFLSFSICEDSCPIEATSNACAGYNRYKPREFPPVKNLHWTLKKRILVTGGAGFVGSHLVDRLMQDGHVVIAMDNFATGQRHNVEHWLGHPNFELLHHDVADTIHIQVDEIYHLASPASPPHYMLNPIRTIKANTLGTLNMLGMARRTNARFLFASTSEIYGDPLVHPQPEKYWGNVNPIGPRACYDESKRLGETLTYAYAEREGVPVRIARIFNTYGPRMQLNDGRVVSNFIIQSLTNRSLTVYGTGQQSRSFQYISDLVEGLVRLMASNYTQPVNLGNPDEFTVIQLAKIVLELTDGTSDLVYKDPLVDDPQRRRPDISTAKRELDWSPGIKLHDGLKLTIKYFKDYVESIPQ